MQRSSNKAESSSARGVDQQRNVKGRDGEKTPQGKQKVCWKCNGKKGFNTFRVLRLSIGLNTKIGDREWHGRSLVENISGDIRIFILSHRKQKHLRNFKLRSCTIHTFQQL